jgi:hypothetical protein
MVSTNLRTVENQRYYQKNKKEILLKCKDYQKSHHGEINNYHKVKVVEYRNEIFRLLGGKCVRCGFLDIRALQIDHIYGGGNRERRNFKNTAYDAYLRFVLSKIRSGSKDYQLLCANCNWIKRRENKEGDK